MSERKLGWYWTRVSMDYYCSWEPSKWLGHDWSTNEDRGYHGFPLIVGDRIPTPDEMEGWQVVPKRPDDQQVDAGCEATGECERLGECHHDCDCSVAPKVYRAMLSAAPKPGDV